MASRDPEQHSAAAGEGEAASLVDDVDGIPCSKVQVSRTTAAREQCDVLKITILSP